MIDQSIEGLIKKQITEAVNQYVETVMADTAWQKAFESRIMQFTQDRITSRMQNVSVIPEIVDTIKTSVDDIFSRGQVPGIAEYIEQDRIVSLIDASIQNFVSDSLDQLINDATWINKIQQHIEVNLVSKVTERISHIDLDLLISGIVDKNVQRWKQELAQDFHSTGIKDIATQCELVISDGAVVAQTGLASNTLMVEQDLITKNLVVTGTVNTDCESWDELANSVAQKTQTLLGDQWCQQLVSQVLDLARDQGIDFQQVTINGAPLLQGDTLNSSVTKTAIQQLGTLNELTVSGPTKLSNTVNVANRRVGINTDAPEMALMIWDEEVSITMGKFSKDRAWIGPTRKQALDLGVNRQKALSIEPDGLVVVDKLRLDRWKISFGNSVPNHSGTRGDLVINCDPRPNTPFAWQCLGSFKWQPVGV